MKTKLSLFAITSLLLLSGCNQQEETEQPKKEKRTRKKETKKKSQKHAYARDWLSEDLTDYLA